MDAEMHPFFATDSLAPFIKDFMLKFHANVFLMIAIEKFAKAIFGVPEIAAGFAPDIIIFCMEEAVTRRSVTLSALSYRIIHWGKTSAGKYAAFERMLSFIPGYLSFVDNELKNRMLRETSPYGGQIPNKNV
jgi:hypothetical protein